MVFSLAQSVYTVREGETATVCLVASTHDLPLIRFHLIVLYQGGNATGKFTSPNVDKCKTDVRVYLAHTHTHTHTHTFTLNTECARHSELALFLRNGIIN